MEHPRTLSRARVVLSSPFRNTTATACTPQPDGCDRGNRDKDDPLPTVRLPSSMQVALTAATRPRDRVEYALLVAAEAAAWERIEQEAAAKEQLEANAGRSLKMQRACRRLPHMQLAALIIMSSFIAQSPRALLRNMQKWIQEQLEEAKVAVKDVQHSGRAHEQSPRADKQQRMRKQWREQERVALRAKANRTRAPPPTSTSCTSEVVLRREVSSLDRCVANVNYGCAVHPSGLAAMYVKNGCRGTFWCSGNPSGICGIKGKHSLPLHAQVTRLGQTCSCSSNVTLREELNDPWKSEAREAARESANAEREALRVDKVRPGDSEYASRFRNACVPIPSTVMVPPAAHVVQVANGSVMMPIWHWTNAHKMPPPNNTLAGLYWLHMPKAGTALVALIVRYTCPAIMASIYKGKRLYYPDAIFKWWFGHGFVSGAGCSFDWAMRQRCAVNPRFTWMHTALPWDDAHMKRSQFNASSLVVMLRRPIDRLVSAYAYRLHGLAWANNVATHKQRRLIEKVAPSPILFYALHSCGVQARLLSGATSMREDGVLVDTASQAGELRPMACSSARLERGLKILEQVERLNENQVDELCSPGRQVGRTHTDRTRRTHLDSPDFPRRVFPLDVGLAPPRPSYGVTTRSRCWTR